MTIEDAISLIVSATLHPHPSQQWVDLGCGNGTFSYALASLLPDGSNIICVDKETGSKNYLRHMGKYILLLSGSLFKGNRCYMPVR